MNDMFRWTLVAGLTLNFGCNGPGDTDPVAEICDNNTDDDADGDADCDDQDCSAEADCQVEDEDCDNGRDDDGDGDEDCDDSECRSDDACKPVEVFEPYVMFVDGNFLYDAATDTIASAIGTDGSPIPPTIAITIAEEAYFDAYDDKYTCGVVYYIEEGTVAREALSDGTLTHAGFWMPTTAVFDTNCENFDVDLYGDGTSVDYEALFGQYEYGVGVGQVSTKLAADKNWKDFITANTSADFAFDTYVVGGGIGLRAGEDSSYGQQNWAMGYAVDKDFAIIVDDADNAQILSNTDVLGTETGLPPTAYYRIGAFYGFDVEAVYLGG